MGVWVCGCVSACGKYTKNRVCDKAWEKYVNPSLFLAIISYHIHGYKYILRLSRPVYGILP